MTWKIRDLEVFVTAVECLNLTKTAEKLNASKASVSKSLTHLEQTMGCRLLERNTRRVRVTDEGQRLYQQGLALLSQIAEINAEMSGLSETPKGTLNIALPAAFTREILTPHLPDFFARFPDIKLNLQVVTQKTDLIRDQLDLAVVVGRPEDSDYQMIPLLRPELILVASPSYVAANPLAVYKLIHHIKICETRYALANFTLLIDGEETYWDLSQTPSTVNDPLTVRETVALGVGIGILPDIFAQRYIASGRLVQVAPEVQISTASSELNILTPTRRLMPKRAKLFIDFLKERIAHA